MRPLGTIGTWRAAPRTLAAFVALALSSGAAFAMCTGTAGVNIVAAPATLALCPELTRPGLRAG